jgi:predicted HTH domain antitoxin
MHVEFDLPEDIAKALGSSDPSRAALEALAAEGYRLRLIGRGQVSRLLGFSTPMEADAFLKERDIPLNYGLEELEQDIATQELLFKKQGSGAKRPA